MDAAAAEEALRGLEGDWGGRAIEAISGGWSFWTFRVGRDHAARFPRSEAAAHGLERELVLLPALAERVSYRVPVPVAVGRRAGRPFAVAPWIGERALESRDVATGAAPSPEHAGRGRARVAQVLSELHGFPIRRAAELLGAARLPSAWRSRYRALRKTVAERVEPRLDAALRDRVAAGFARFLEDGLPPFEHPVLVHCDLGVEHLRVDAQGRVVGVIDFEDAAIGDPAIDFAGLWIAFGSDVVRDAVARYGGPPDTGFSARLHFYVWMSAVHEILHGLDTADDALVADASRSLADRIASR
jgi:aminoglycoside 2''-phosphotransferase